MQSILKDYLSSISSIPVLDHDTSINYFKELNDPNISYSRKEKIKSHLINSNLKLVISIAKTYKSCDELPFIDIIQEGNIGLMKAVERYKWDMGYKFSTYATWWIRQAISIYISKHRRTVRLPSHAIGVQRRIMATIDEYNEKCGIPPTIDELKLILSDVSETIIDATMHAGMGTVSIYKPNKITDDDTKNSLEMKLCDETSNPIQQLMNAELISDVISVLNELTNKEAAVIRMRFGLYDAGINREDYMLKKNK